MKPVPNFKWLLALFFVVVNAQLLLAQSKSDIFDSSKPVTYLGVDYSLTKFIGIPTNKSMTFSPWTVVGSKDNGVVTNDEFRDSYTVQWNQIFLDKPKQFDVAKAIHRPSVKYALDVAIKSNQALKKDFFSNNPSDFKTLTAQNISDAVKNYNFQGNTGIGLIFFVEGMDKGIEQEGVWITFVDMDSKTVLFTTYEFGKPGGSGFMNYWVTPLRIVLKKMDSEFNTWK
jgi:hypothetical protein